MGTNSQDDPAGVAAGAGIEFYRDQSGHSDRFVRALGAVVLALMVFAVVDVRPGGLVVASVVLISGLVYAVVWPMQEYSVRDFQLIHRRWPRCDTVDLDDLVRVEARWVPYAGNTLRFRDRSGHQITISALSGNEELREVIGQRMQDAHPLIARTSIMGPGATAPLGMIRSEREV